MRQKNQATEGVVGQGRDQIKVSEVLRKHKGGQSTTWKVFGQQIG